MSFDGPPATRADSAADTRTDGVAGKVALITGATSGIGRATALALARQGARVVLVGRDAERGRAVARKAEITGGTALFLAADLSKPEAPAEIVAETVDRLGGLDIAFNNAGFQEPRALLADQAPELYDTVFDINLRSVYMAMRAQIAAMLERGGGVIVNNASVSGVRNPNPGLALYCASKAAVISLTKSAAMEYAPRGIRINALSPGRVETPMMLGSGIADMQAVADGLPARRLGRPEEAAAAVLWLCSSGASFVHGHNLCVDGGFLAQ